MKHKLILIILSSVLCTIAATAVVVAEPPPAKSGKTSAEKTTSAEPPVAGKVTLGVTIAETQLIATGWRASKLIDAEVKNEKGETLGTIDDMVIAPNGQLSIAVLEVGGFLGMGDHQVAIPVQQLQFSKNQAVLRGGSKDALKALPEFDYTS